MIFLAGLKKIFISKGSPTVKRGGEDIALEKTVPEEGRGKRNGSTSPEPDPGIISRKVSHRGKKKGG